MLACYVCAALHSLRRPHKLSTYNLSYVAGSLCSSCFRKDCFLLCRSMMNQANEFTSSPLARTRNAGTKRNYKCLHEGPINAEVLRDGVPFLLKKLYPEGVSLHVVTHP